MLSGVRYSVAAALLASASSWCAPLGFSDQTIAAGLDFVHVPSVDHRSGPMSGGGAVGDFDGDGFPDLFLVGSGGTPDALYINGRDGTFARRPIGATPTSLHRGVAATVADYDDDGDDDVYVTSFGPVPGIDAPGTHRLYRNDGDIMSEVAAEVGLNQTTELYPDGYGAAFGDYDRDGDLDVFVGAWHGAPSLGSRLLSNQAGRFVDVTAGAGLGGAPMHAFGAVWADMDGDRFPELIVAGDFGTARYFRNERDGTFAEIDPGTGSVVTPEPFNWTIGKAYNGMGITVGDFDRDGRADWFLTAIWPTYGYASDFWGNGLYLNRGGHAFAEVAAMAGVADGGWGWGTTAVDLDNDGWEDLPMTNGWPLSDPTTGAVFTDEPTYVFRNRGHASFEEVHAASGLAHTGQGRALLHLDYDRDGDMDLLVLGNSEPARLFRNELIAGAVPADAHWLQLRLDTSANERIAPHGAGAVITVTTGDIVQSRQVVLGGTYLGQSELVAHFGLGTATIADTVRVDWNNGKVTTLHDVAVDRRLTVFAPCPVAGARIRPAPATPPKRCSTSADSAGTRAQARADRNATNHAINQPIRNTK